MNIKVVPAQPIDAENIRQVYADAYRENRDLGFPASAETVSAQEIVGWLLTDKMWVAKADDDIVGAVRLRDTDPEFPTLSRLAVASKHKGAGIGGLLMDAVEEDARLRGCKGLILSVAEAHPFLSKIYAKRSYQAIGPRNPQHTLYSEIMMRKVF